MSLKSPFEEDKQTKWASVGAAYVDGIISLRTAVRLLGITDKPDERGGTNIKGSFRKDEIRKIEHFSNRQKKATAVRVPLGMAVIR